MRRLLLVTVLLLGACQQAPVPRAAPIGGSVALKLQDEGDALMAKAAYVEAVEKYREAVDLEPGSVPVRFALGSAYSFLEKRPEAVAQFRWVLANAPASSVEQQEARRWLLRAGVLVEPAARPGRSELEGKGEPGGKGSISGSTQWPGLDPTREPVRMRIALAGADDLTRSINRKTSIALGDPYEFKDVPEGRYRVFGVLGEQTIIWDQEVTVRVGKDTELALTQAMSQSPRFVFPQEPKVQPEPAASAGKAAPTALR